VIWVHKKQTWQGGGWLIWQVTGMVLEGQDDGNGGGLIYLSDIDGIWLKVCSYQKKNLNHWLFVQIRIFDNKQ
jgi:hypothetical protein